MRYKKIKIDEIKNIGKGINDSLIVINTPLITHLLIPTFFILLFAWVIISGQSPFYIFPLLALLAFLIHKLWVVFEPIKIIKINRLDKFFILIPRNLIQRLFVKSTKINFDDIEKFIVTEGSEIMLEPTRFIISAVFKDSTTVFFTSTSKKIIVKEMMDFLTQILSSTKRV